MPTVREALEQLPTGIALGVGGLRVFIRFRDGEVTSAKVAYFRVPANQAERIGDAPRELDRELLRQLAGALDVDSQACELVAEYTDGGTGLRLHWVDFSWGLDV